MAAKRRVVRFFCDLGNPYPLWESGTEQYTMTPTDYGLRQALAQRLARVAAQFAASWGDMERAEREGVDWRATPAGVRWMAEGDEALAVLRREVDDIADVVDER